jgi:hypothetical protein
VLSNTREVMVGIAADRFDCRRRHGNSLLAIYMSSVNRRAGSEQGRWSPATPISADLAHRRLRRRPAGGGRSKRAIGAGG